MKLLFRLLADLVVVVHAAYVAFVVLGLVLVVLGYLRKWDWVRNPWFRGLHLTAILLVVLEAWCGITCPLTDWEQSLRTLSGQESYQGAFVANLVHDLLFYQAPAWVFTLAYTLFAGLVAGTWWLAPPRR
jgi:lysylphosphatidylglycerol synthetase-like protein (DUF2156 family)